jgi:hypothetical protein
MALCILKNENDGAPIPTDLRNITTHVNRKLYIFVYNGAHKRTIN